MLFPCKLIPKNGNLLAIYGIMKKMFYLISLSLLISSSVVISRGFRVTQLPNGSKYSCNTCHTNGGGTPRNSFGLAVETIIGMSSIEFWGPEFASQDVDGDGYSNGVELQDPNGEWTFGSVDPGDISAVSHPGDADDIPKVTSINYVSDSKNVFKLENSYPNPFNPTTSINFNIAENSNVVLEVYNSLGEKVATLVDQYFIQGKYSTVWNAKDDFGNKVNSGLYIYRLVANDFVDSKKMVLLK